MTSADISLQRDIVERVRGDARRFGVATLRPGVIAQRFKGRAEPKELYDLSAAAIRSVKRGAARGAPANAPAALDPLRMFDCGPKSMRLSVGGCARLWRSAQEHRPEPWEGRAACLVCPVGAANAGMRVSPVATLTEALRIVCSRCLNPTPRLINERFCISCYNRHCEALRGRNARGGRPKLADQLMTMQAAVSSDGVVKLVVEAHASGGAELMVNHSRHAESVQAFGWSLTGPGDVADFEVAA